MSHRAATVVGAAAAVLLAACGASTDSGREAVTSSSPPASAASTDPSPPATDAPPVVTEPPATEPPVTEPPLTDPPPTAPPLTDPPTPAATEPPATTPPATDPPATEPPPTDPPATEPPSTEPPDPGQPVATPPPVGRVADARPTAGATTVHVGWQLEGPWTPLATWDGAAWIEASREPPLDPAFSSVAVTSVDLANPLAGLTYTGATELVCSDERRGPVIEAAPTDLPGDGSYRGVGLAADWDVQPRGLRRAGIDSVDYQRIGESIVSAAGVDPSGGDVVEVLRADLEGDGVEEVFVTFEKLTDGGGAPGDFVVVYARYPTAGGAVVDQVLFEYYPQAWTDFPTIGRAGVLAIADLNGDAVMEVVLWNKFWDSSLAELFVFDGATTLTRVARNGCSV